MRFSVQRFMAIATILLSCMTVQLFIGCDGSDSSKAVKETVEELSGKNIVDKGQKMKQQIDDLSAQEARRVQQELSNGPDGQQGSENPEK